MISGVMTIVGSIQSMSAGSISTFVTNTAVITAIVPANMLVMCLAILCLPIEDLFL